VQKRSLNWPQDLDGETRVVELYFVNDYSQVSYMYVPSTVIHARFVQSRTVYIIVKKLHSLAGTL